MYVSNKGYPELLWPFAGEVQSKCSECEATTRQLDERTAKVEELKCKVWLLADVARQVGAAAAAGHASGGACFSAGGEVVCFV